MFTQCPQCQTVFRVTPATLKAAQGRVRCGRCRRVFNALTYLIEREDESDAVTEEPRSPPEEAQDDSPAEAPEDSSLTENDSERDESLDPAGPEAEEIPESALEFTAEDLSKVFVQAPAQPLPRRPEAQARAPEDDTAEHEILDIELETPDPPETVVLEGDDSLVIVEGGDATLEFATPENSDSPTETDPDAAMRPPAKRSAAAAADALDADMRREIESAFAADPATRAEFVLPSGKRVALNRGDDEVEDGGAAALARDTMRQRRIHLAWTIGSVFLAFMLVGQLVHHNRHALIRSTTLGPMLGSLYASLGDELTPEWNVQAYELRQWGAAADPGASGTLRVRASLMNGAAHAQPYPLLRLTLQDRFGERVGLRDLEPREYLNDTPQRNQLLGAGQRIDAEIAILDPGKDAVGFEIDVCLRDKSSITCANDAARQAG